MGNYKESDLVRLSEEMIKNDVSKELMSKTAGTRLGLGPTSVSYPPFVDEALEVQRAGLPQLADLG